MTNRRNKVVTDLHAEQRRQSLIMKIAAAAILVALIVGIGIWIGLSRQSSTGSSATVGAATGHAYRITAAPPGTTPKATVTLIEDFQCPACRAFESQFSDALAQLRADPDVAVDYQPIAFLDRMSTTDYSTRAANASACVAQSTGGRNGFQTWLAFHNLLYANQPAEGGAGLADGELVSIAKQAGADGVSQCIKDGQFKDWTKQATQAALAAGMQGTPTVLINGTKYSLSTPQDLLAAVRTAAA